MSDQDKVREPIVNALLAIVVVLCHLLVLIVILGAMKLSEYLIGVLWPNGDPKVMGVQVHEIVQTAEVVVLIVFLFVAAMSAALRFWRWR